MRDLQIRLRLGLCLICAWTSVAVSASGPAALSNFDASRDCKTLEAVARNITNGDLETAFLGGNKFLRRAILDLDIATAGKCEKIKEYIKLLQIDSATEAPSEPRKVPSECRAVGTACSVVVVQTSAGGTFRRADVFRGGEFVPVDNKFEKMLREVIRETQVFVAPTRLEPWRVDPLSKWDPRVSELTNPLKGLQPVPSKGLQLLKPGEAKLELKELQKH